MKNQSHLMLIAILSVLLNCQIAICQDSPDTNAMIKDMIAARRKQIQIPFLTKDHGTFSMDKAYQIQNSMAIRTTRMLGPVCGYKVAYASESAQKGFPELMR